MVGEYKERSIKYSVSCPQPVIILDGSEVGEVMFVIDGGAVWLGFHLSPKT